VRSPYTCADVVFGARGRIRTDDLPITRRLPTDLACSRWVPCRSRRIQKDRLARQATRSWPSPRATRAGGWFDAVQGRSGWQDSRQIRYPWTVGDQSQQHPWPGSPFGGEALAVFHAEIAAGDCGPRQADVALDQVGHPARLHATKRPGRPRRRPGHTEGRGPGGATSRRPWRSQPQRRPRSSGTKLGRCGRCRPCGRSSALRERGLPAATAPVRPKLGSPLEPREQPQRWEGLPSPETPYQASLA
jgi:hypothetical protein